MLLNCGVGKDSWESLGLQGDPTSPSWRRSILGVHWKDWCWSWNSSTLAIWCEELTHLKRLWCWERLRAEGRQGDDRGWDGWMASPTQWTWVWVSSKSWWWTGKPGVLQSMRLQSRTRLSWTEPKGNQPWIFIGRIVAEAEAPILWPHDTKNWLIRKDPDAGKDWRQEEKGMTEDEIDGWMALLTQWSWGWASSGRWWRTGKLGMLPSMVSHQVAKRGTSGSSSVLPDAEYSWMNIQNWFPLGLIGFISLQSKGFSKTFTNTTVQKYQFSALSLLYSPILTSIHDHWKNHSFD